MTSPSTPADKDAPVVVQKKAIDVTPYNHALWCSIEGGKPFANTIYWRNWSDDGTKILFGLDTHNGFSAAPDELMGVVEVRGPEDAEYLAEKLREDAEKMAKRQTEDMALRERLRAFILERHGQRFLGNETASVFDIAKPEYNRVASFSIGELLGWVESVVEAWHRSELSRAGGERADAPIEESPLFKRLRSQIEQAMGEMAGESDVHAQSRVLAGIAVDQFYMVTEGRSPSADALLGKHEPLAERLHKAEEENAALRSQLAAIEAARAKAMEGQGGALKYLRWLVDHSQARGGHYAEVTKELDRLEGLSCVAATQAAELEQLRAARAGDAAEMEALQLFEKRVRLGIDDDLQRTLTRQALADLDRKRGA